MVRENYANFAETNLQTPNPLPSSGAASFTVTTNQGALFPANNFYVTIDTEVIWISSRSGDTFTIGARGQDGTQATSHVGGGSAFVTLTILNTHLVHLWSNVCDTFHPDVPPIQQVPAVTPSQWDNEFESQGNWILSPAPASGSIFQVGPGGGVGLFSFLNFGRNPSDNGSYTAYVPFSPGAPFSAICKVYDATDWGQSYSGEQANVTFFVSDQTNPAGGGNSNRFEVDSILGINVINNFARLMRVSSWQNNVWQGVSGNQIGMSALGPIYLRIDYDNNGNWNGYIGDGYTYWKLGTKNGWSINVESLGFTFGLYGVQNNKIVAQTAVIDFARVTIT
jgi:hypothetical protein